MIEEASSNVFLTVEIPEKVSIIPRDWDPCPGNKNAVVTVNYPFLKT
jgi:hypothetical protein